MDIETIKQNLLSALGQLMQLRLVVSSPHELVADLPALYVILAVFFTPWVCIGAVVLGFVFRYSARFEHDVMRRG